MTMIQSDIREALVKIISALPDTGMVYNRYKYSSDWNKFLDQFTVTIGGARHIRGWWVAAPILPGGNTQGDTFDSAWENYIYTIRGVLTYSDTNSSELTFTDLVYTIRNKLAVQGVLGLSTPGAEDNVIDGSIECTVPVMDIRTFGSFLCHYCEIRFTVGVNSRSDWEP